MGNNLNSVILNKIFKGVLTVTFGSMIMKFAIFFFNIVLVKYAYNEHASDISKIFTFGFSWSSILYFCSSRYIAKTILIEKKSISDQLNLINYLIFLMTPILVLIIFITFYNHNLNFCIKLILFIVAAAFYDYLINVSNAIGMNKLAAAGQFSLGCSVFFSGILLLLDFHLFEKYIYILVLFSLFFIAFTIFKILRKSSLNIEKENGKLFFRYKKLIYYSFPILMGAIFVNPLILWCVSFILKISDKNFIFFVSCLNILGLTMLLPGQINTATFNILAKSLNNKNINFWIFFISLISAIVAILLINLIFPYLDFIYTVKITSMNMVVFFMTLCTLPFVCCQYIESRLFLMNKPWQDAFSNIIFGISFVFGSYIISLQDYSLLMISVLLFISYLLKALFLAWRLHVVRKTSL